MTPSISQYIEILGITAVVVSLLFVGFELNQANNIAIRETRTEIANILYDLNRATVEEREIAEIRSRMRSPINEFSETEKEQALAVAGMHVNVWVVINSAVDADLVPEQVVESYKGFVRQTFADYPGLAPYVDEIMGGRTPMGAFEYFDVILEEIEKSKNNL